MKLKFIIYLYYLLGLLISPIYFLYFLLRIFKGKENLSHISERLGISSLNIPKANNIIWIHAASIGESLAALTLIEAIKDNNIGFKNDLITNNLQQKALNNQIKYLITTGTTSAREILRNKLPQGAIHQFLPIDNGIFIKSFLKFWKPKIAIFIESEIWPGIIYEASKCSNLLLFNARLSNKSFLRWKKFSFLFKMLLDCFDEIIVQSDEDLKKYQAFVNDKIINLGNIKFANKKLSVNKNDLKNLINIYQGKKIVLFASTHASDEKVILKIIQPIKKLFPEVHFLVVLRHPGRINQLEKFCNSLNISYQNRGKDKKLPNLNKELYIVDTFSELGLFYTISDISFIGGSFNIGGHSPLEAAHFNNLIIFGPNMTKCQDIANLMLTNKAAIQITDEIQLQHLLEYYLADKNAQQVKRYKTNALNFVNSYQQVLQNYLAIIMKYL